MLVKILICDDNEIETGIIQVRLDYYFKDRDMTPQFFVFHSGEELLAEYKEGMADLIFLDIIMMEKNGMETAEQIRKKDERVKIIFVTSSKEYALDSYNVFASGYLVKPVEAMTLEKLLNRIMQEVSAERYYVYRTHHKSRRVLYQEMEFVESNNTRLTIHLTDGSMLQSYGKLSDLEKELSDRRFLRCHQSYLINMEQVKGVQEDFLMNSGKHVLIRKKEIRQMRENYFHFLDEERKR